MLVAFDLLDLAAADEDLQLTASCFDGVEVHLDFNGVSTHHSPDAENEKESVGGLRNKLGWVIWLFFLVDKYLLLHLNTSKLNLTPGGWETGSQEHHPGDCGPPYDLMRYPLTKNSLRQADSNKTHFFDICPSMRPLPSSTIVQFLRATVRVLVRVMWTLRALPTSALSGTCKGDRDIRAPGLTSALQLSTSHPHHW